MISGLSGFIQRENPVNYEILSMARNFIQSYALAKWFVLLVLLVPLRG
jgi:hypothetical protein